jgi:hypothetical protein
VTSIGCFGDPSISSSWFFRMEQTLPISSKLTGYKETSCQDEMGRGSRDFPNRTDLLLLRRRSSFERLNFNLRNFDPDLCFPMGGFVTSVTGSRGCLTEVDFATRDTRRSDAGSPEVEIAVIGSLVGWIDFSTEMDVIFPRGGLTEVRIVTGVTSLSAASSIRSEIVVVGAVLN